MIIIIKVSARESERESGRESEKHEGLQKGSQLWIVIGFNFEFVCVFYFV